VRVYINAEAIDVPGSATALQAIEAWNPVVAGAVRNGDGLITDSRGIVAANDSPVHNGAIFRVIRARQSTTDVNDSDKL
jgi:hypothetical protein